MIPPCFLDELPSDEPGEDTSSQQDETSQEDDVLEVIQLVNKEQEAAGQEHLEVDEDFMELAQIRAMEWRKAGLITYNTENEPSIPPNSPEYPEDKYHIEVTTDTQTETEARNKKTYSYSDAIGQLTIRKHDQDEKGLDGALFDIDVTFTDGTHTTVQGWEVDNGAWLFTWTYPQDNHNPATVTVKEVQAPRGYLMDTQSQTAVVAPTYTCVTHVETWTVTIITETTSSTVIDIETGEVVAESSSSSSAETESAPPGGGVCRLY